MSVAAIVAVWSSPAGADQDVRRPIQTMVQSARYGRVDMALGQLAGERQGALLLGEAWSAASQEQRSEFVSLFHRLFALIALPKVQENFEHLETVLYDEPTVEGDTASITSTVVVLHAMAKREIRVRYDLVRVEGSWRVLDAKVLGTGSGSMIEEIRSEQIEPILEEGGLSHLLELMRERLTHLEEKQG
ncbi:MAG: ABC transporter substrate-binding protein [Myxococcota bacterium]